MPLTEKRSPTINVRESGSPAVAAFTFDTSAETTRARTSRTGRVDRPLGDGDPRACWPQCRMSADTPPTPGEDGSVDELFALAYRELRLLARARLRDGGRNAVLDTTALVHESYLKLSKSSGLLFPDRPRFLVYAGKVMRSIIVDMVRQRRTDRHGGDAPHLTLTGDVAEQAGLPAEEEHILRVHEALDEMAKLDERMAKVVEMRYFGGLNDLEIAAALGVTDRTVRRDWEQARLFLAEALR
ncbi:MAG TPA: ECF-type sigma factor [Burkholderiaceae bacterium]